MPSNIDDVPPPPSPGLEDDLIPPPPPPPILDDPNDGTEDDLDAIMRKLSNLSQDCDLQADVYKSQ